MSMRYAIGIQWPLSLSWESAHGAFVSSTQKVRKLRYEVAATSTTTTTKDGQGVGRV